MAFSKNAVIKDSPHFGKNVFILIFCDIKLKLNSKKINELR